MRGNTRADALAGKAMVDGIVMVRDKVDLIRSVALNCRIKKETERDNVHVQRIIDTGIARGEGRPCCLAGKARKPQSTSD